MHSFRIGLFISVLTGAASFAPVVARDPPPVAHPEYEIRFGFRVLHEFAWGQSPRSTGAEPAAGLIQASDGSFYGTTQYDGPSTSGTVFRMKLRANVVPVPSYPGGSPGAALTEGSDGKLYGTDASNHLYTIAPDGTYTLLYKLKDDGSEGSNLSSALVEAGDGNFYGTAAQGGEFDSGTLFRLTPAGGLTVMHQFSGRDGSSPWPDLTLGSDGTLYGVAASGGQWNGGVVYRFTTSGSFAVLHEFDSVNEGRSAIGLVQATDGWLYGATSYEGPGDGNGVAYRVSHAGDYEKLHVFDCQFEGCRPRVPPTQASDGNMYGVTVIGGKYGFGTVFRMTPLGHVAPLHSFNNVDGAYPGGRLVEGTDGHLYGTTMRGGSGDAGVIFAIGLKP